MGLLRPLGRFACSLAAAVALFSSADTYRRDASTVTSRLNRSNTSPITDANTLPEPTLARGSTR